MSVADSIFSMQIRVFYEDTDFGGIVYYANYLKFMERARTEFLRSLGVNQSSLLDQERRLFVVKSADIKFVSPARFDDLLVVTAEVKTVRRASMIFNQECRVVKSARDNIDHSAPSDKGASGNGNNASDRPVASRSPAASNSLVASAEVMIACLDADSFKPGSIPAVAMGPLKMVLNP